MEYVFIELTKLGMKMGDGISFFYQDGDDGRPISGIFDGADSLGIKLIGGDYYYGTQIDATTIEKESSERPVIT